MTKKLLIWVLALALLPPAAAWGEAQSDLPADAALPEEEYRPLTEVGMKIWIPAHLKSEPLTEEDRANGYIAYFADEDGREAVSVVCIGVGKLPLEDLRALLVRKGIAGVADAEIGGRHWLTYPVPEWDGRAYIFSDEAVFLLEITFAPTSDPSFSALPETVVASLRPI